MPPSQAISRFLDLVDKVASGATARSENDLSSNFSIVLHSLGLTTVIDTSVTASGRKRPDILAYISVEDADLVLPAEIVFESKKPEEVAQFSDLSEALVSAPIWSEKTLPYVQANIARIHYFGLTTFTDFAILPITGELRREFIAVLGGKPDSTLRQQARRLAIQFKLAPSPYREDPRSAVSWHGTGWFRHAVSSETSSDPRPEHGPGVVCRIALYA